MFFKRKTQPKPDDIASQLFDCLQKAAIESSKYQQAICPKDLEARRFLLSILLFPVAASHGLTGATQEKSPLFQYPGAGLEPTVFRRSALEGGGWRVKVGGCMANYHHRGHTVSDCKYHLIWVTKYRWPVLKGDLAVRCRDLIREICRAREVAVVRGAVSPDHVHLLVSAPPVLSPAKLAQYLKGRSSRKLQEEFPSLQKRYWGQHLWARGYFCATVGAVDEKTIKRYIEEQKWDEDGEGTFRIVADPP